MRYNTLGIHLTNACPLTCDHCITDSSPRSRGDLSWEQIEGAVRSSATYVDGVCVTGGEPMLRRELALATIQLTHELGLRSSMVTSGYWARTPAKAAAIVAELVAAGLDKLAVSFDQFHLTQKTARYIGAGTLHRLLEAAAPTRMELVVQYCGTGGDEAHEIATSAAARFGARLETAEVLPFGRGVALARRRDANVSDVPAGPCGVVGRPILTPEVDFYTCCGPARGAQAHSPLRLSIGSASQAGSALAAASVDPIINSIHTQGPKALFDRLGPDAQQRVSQNLRDSSMCSLCRAITDDDQAVAELRGELARDALRLVALSGVLHVAQDEEATRCHR
ncbi:radical SAM protein [Nocardia cyriacigeorgica]|uniref:radical SAM protein n=2 Tax=Nocardia TaxID=1817 RepID=UPI003512863E